MSLAARIAALRLELAALEAAQRDELIRMIRAIYPTRQVFSVIDLWLLDELRVAFLDAEIPSPQALGIRLRQWRGHGITREHGLDEHGARWSCE